MTEREDIINVIDDLVQRNEMLEATWKHSYGWSPAESAKLLEESRLDRQVSLCRTLKIWCAKSSESEAEARLILAWVNLRALVEGSLKFFLSIYAHDYEKGHKAIKPTQNHPQPDGLMLNPLIEYFSQVVWLDDQRDELKPFVRLVQERGNAIHSYQHREMGTVEEFYDGIRMYHKLLDMIEGQLPPEPEYDQWE